MAAERELGTGRSEKRVLVVGGGVIGLCTAYYLTRANVEVVLLERDEIGAGASSGNAGAVAPGHGPMTRPGRILQALKWMRDPTSPLYLPPRWNPSLWRWLLRFNSFCTEKHVRHAMELLGPLGHMGRRLFDELVEEEGLHCEYRPNGYYDVFRTQEGFEGAQRELPLQRQHGYDTRALPGPALEELEPALRAGTAGGLFFPESATLDPGRFLKELARAGLARGLDLRTGAEVEEVVSQGGRAAGVRLKDGEVVEGGAVVLATGAYSLGLARATGLELPIEPAKGYHRDLPAGDGGVQQLSHTLMLGERYVFCTPMGGFLRLAGTLELSGLNHTIVIERLENLTDSAGRYLSGLDGGSSQDDWVGLRPVTPDGLPVMGPAPDLDGLFIANGHAMLGLTLGPVTGKLLAEWIVEGVPPSAVHATGAGAPGVDLSALRPDRF
jgi:D-amino-acid dehydrogenase